MEITTDRSVFIILTGNGPSKEKRKAKMEVERIAFFYVVRKRLALRYPRSTEYRTACTIPMAGLVIFAQIKLLI